MFKSQKKLKTVESQIRLLFVLIITIVVSDVLVAIVIEALPSMSLLTQLLVDSILLVIVVFPVLYYFTFRPLTVSITELKIAHEEILKLHRAVESSGEVIFITDRDGLITYINAEFTNLYGYTAWEVIGKTTPRILKSGMMLPENYKYFWDTLLNKDAVRSEYLNKTKDGRLITIEGSANPILNEQKEIIGFIGIQRDITKRKLAEEEIILKNKLLLEINAEKDKFFSILAHDLRGPLSAFVAVTQ
ncbi:MAG: PAS domain S-box protein, partial [Bacteroidetes bacterium]